MIFNKSQNNTLEYNQNKEVSPEIQTITQSSNSLILEIRCSHPSSDLVKILINYLASLKTREITFHKFIEYIHLLDKEGDSLSHLLRSKRMTSEKIVFSFG